MFQSDTNATDSPDLSPIKNLSRILLNQQVHDSASELLTSAKWDWSGLDKDRMKLRLKLCLGETFLKNIPKPCILAGFAAICRSFKWIILSTFFCKLLNATTIFLTRNDFQHETVTEGDWKLLQSDIYPDLASAHSESKINSTLWELRSTTQRHCVTVEKPPALVIWVILQRDIGNKSSLV